MPTSEFIISHLREPRYAPVAITMPLFHIPTARRNVPCGHIVPDLAESFSQRGPVNSEKCALTYLCRDIGR